MLAINNSCSNQEEVNHDIKDKANITIKVSSNRELTLDLAARKIQLFFRKIVAAKAYKHMFDNGTYFKQYKEIPSTPIALLDYLKIAQKLSTKAINEIKPIVGDLTEQETAFLTRITQLPNFRLTHQTLYDLDHVNNKQEKILTIYSHHFLQQKNHNCQNKTSAKDIKSLSNNDFVFFSIDFSGSDLSIAPTSSITVNNEDYGYKAYLVHLQNASFGYLTLTDHFYTRAAPSGDRDDFIKKYPKLRRYLYANYYGSLGETDIPIFTEKDMLKGLAYYCIHLLRKTKCSKLNKFIYQDSSLADINNFFNIIFTPEFHIPRMFISNNFQKHKLREITIEEFYKLVKFYKQPYSIRRYVLSEYSNEQELINMNDPLAKNAVLTAAYVFNKSMEYAVKDANTEILSFCLYWTKKIADIGCLSWGYNSDFKAYQFCSSILQHDTAKMLEFIKNNDLDFGLYLKLCDILVKSQNFNPEISILLNEYITKKNNTCRLNTEEIINLFILSGNINNISEELVKDISYEDISTRFYGYYLDCLQYEGFYLDYAKIIAQAIIKNNYDYVGFAERLRLYVRDHIENKKNIILEDSFIAVLSNPNISQQAKDILLDAFLKSGLLDPNKKITSFNDMTVKSYAKEYYNISL